MGIHKEVMDRAFTGTPSRISGITFDTIIGDLVKYHDMAFPKDPEQTGYLPKYGIESRFTAARIGEREESARVRVRERADRVTLHSGAHG